MFLMQNIRLRDVEQAEKELREGKKNSSKAIKDKNSRDDGFALETRIFTEWKKKNRKISLRHFQFLKYQGRCRYKSHGAE